MARAARLGARVVLLHLTLGENGHPRKSAAEYAKQKWEEALAAAKALGAEARFGAWTDGLLRGGVSPFPYMQFHEGLSMVHGAQARKPHATAFQADDGAKRRIAEIWPWIDIALPEA